MANLNRLKAVLAEQDKTGKWLAEQLGKSTCTVSKWCKNSVQPDLNTLNEIANKLHVDIKDLLVSKHVLIYLIGEDNLLQSLLNIFFQFSQNQETLLQIRFLEAELFC